jgi:hypothetical protein
MPFASKTQIGSSGGPDIFLIFRPPTFATAKAFSRPNLPADQRVVNGDACLG